MVRLPTTWAHARADRERTGRPPIAMRRPIRPPSEASPEEYPNLREDCVEPVHLSMLVRPQEQWLQLLLRGRP